MFKIPIYKMVAENKKINEKEKKKKATHNKNKPTVE